MSVESGVVTESQHSDSLSTDGVGLSPGSIRSAANMQTNFDSASQLWSADGSVDGGAGRAWGAAVPEFSIWGNSAASETANSIWNTGGSGSLSTMWQHIAADEDVKKAETGSSDLPWHTRPVMTEPNGSSESLRFSDLRQGAGPWYGGFGFGSNSVEPNSFRPFSVGGGGDGWGVSSSTAAESQSSSSADWSANKENPVKSDHQSSGWPSSTSGDTGKTDRQQTSWPSSDVNGAAAAAHVRSLSVVSDSGKEADSGKSATTSLSGSMDPAAASTPQPSELSAEELLMAQMISSNDGWGTRPVRQDTPWMIETSSPSAAAVVGNVMDSVGGGAVKADAGGSVWNSPKDVPGTGQYWGGGAPPAEWNSDSDIGVWNDPPSSAGPVNPNMWTGHAGAAAGWSNIGPNSAGRVNTSDLAMALATAGGWPDSATMMNKLAMNAAANNSLDKSQRPTDAQWIAALTKPQQAGGWASDPVPGSWGTADDLIRAQLQLGAQPPRHQFEARPPTTALKIDTWNEPPAVPDTLLHPGHWGQPPVCH